MKRGFRGGMPSNRGFTVVETLIVLAVTAFLFIGVATMINGRQRNAEFSQGVRDLQTQIQRFINETETGHYPLDTNFECRVSGSGPDIRPGANQQGQNSACLYLGRVMHFAVGATNPQEVNVYTLVGLREPGGNPATTWQQSRPRLFAQGSGDPATMPESIINFQMPRGMSVTAMYYNGSVTNPIAGVGFVSTLAPLGAADGTQQIAVVPITISSGPNIGVTKADMVSRVSTIMASAAPVRNPSGGVQICVAGGVPNLWGLITIGGASRQLTVSTQMRSNAQCT